MQYRFPNKGEALHDDFFVLGRFPNQPNQVRRVTDLGQNSHKKAQLKNSIGLFGFSMVSVQLDLCLVFETICFYKE
jgi:hypothetical protein